MEQAEDERNIFEAFANVSPFTVLPGSIENRYPPEPDILCHIEGHGQVGFELTELIDQKYMAGIGLMFKTKEYLNNYWLNGMDKEASALFVEKYRGALIHFEYSQETSFKKREAAAKKAFTKLLQLPNNSNGEVFNTDPELAPVLQWVNIDRIDLVEPTIDVNSYCYLGDPTSQAIRKKFKKKYKCDYPIELLVHINWGIMPHEEVWKAAAEEACSQLLDSPFRKVWVFDNADKKIKYKYEN